METWAACSGAEVADAIAEALREGRVLVPAGFAGRLVAERGGERVLSLRDLSGLVRYEPADLTVTARAGTALTELDRRLAEHGQWLPVRAPDGVDDSLGAAAAMALDGPYRGGYGPLRDRVVALRAVVPAFGELRLGADVVKNVAGYNLVRLLVGSGGSLGVLTEVTLKVAPLPRARAVWTFEADTPAAVARRALELRELAHPWAAIVSLRDGAGWRIWAEWHGRAARLLELRRRLGAPADDPALPRLAGPGRLVRGALPVGRLGDFAAAWPDGAPLVLEWQSGGLWGLMTDAGAAADAARSARERGGTLGWAAGRLAPPDPAVQGLLRALKAQLDPGGVLPPAA